MERNPLPLFSPLKIARNHWASVPTPLRGIVHLGSYILAGLTAAPFVGGGVDMSETAAGGVAAAAAALSGLLFALAIQLFAQALATRPAPSLRERRDLVHNSNLVRGLLANVLYCTLWALVAAIAAGASLFVGWFWPGHVVQGLAIAAMVMTVLMLMMTIRRLFGMADQLLDRSLELPPTPSSTPQQVEGGPR